MSLPPPANEKGIVHSEFQSAQSSEQIHPPPRPPLSKTRLFLIASAPCVVWFAGVGVPGKVTTG